MYFELKPTKPTEGDFIAFYAKNSKWSPRIKKNCIGFLPIQQKNEFARIFWSHHNCRATFPGKTYLQAILHFQGKKHKMKFLDGNWEFVFENEKLKAQVLTSFISNLMQAKKVYLNSSVQMKPGA